MIRHRSFEGWMRRRCLTIAFVLAASASACAPNPIVARDPVPAPGRSDAFACDSQPTLLHAFQTDCTRVARERRIVLRSKG